MTGTDNRLLSDGTWNYEYDAETWNYEYDAEGNRTAKVNIATSECIEFAWDHRNRLTEETKVSRKPETKVS